MGAVVLCWSVLIFGKKSLILLAAPIGAFLVFRFPELGLALTFIAVFNLQNVGKFAAAGTQTWFLSIAKIMGALTVAAWAFRVLRTRQKIFFNKQMLIGFCFVILSLTSTIWAIEPGEPIFALADSSKLLTNFMLFFLVVNMFNKNNIHSFLTVLIATGAGACLMAILQVYMPSMQITGYNSMVEFGHRDAGIVDSEHLKSGGFIRPTGTMGHPNWLSFFMVTLLPLTFYMFLRSKSWLKLFALVVLGMQGVAMVLTHDRMAMVGFLCVAFFCVITQVIKITRIRIVGILLGIVVFFLIAPATYIERVFSPSHYKQSSSINTRWELLMGGLDQFAQHPILGVGSGNFGIHFMIHNKHTEAATTIWHMRDVDKTSVSDYTMAAHNMYVEVAAETGIIGFVLYMAFILMGIRNMNRIRKRPGENPYKLTATMVMISMFGFCCLGFLLHAQLQKIMWIVLGLSVVVKKLDDEAMADSRAEKEAQATIDLNPLPPGDPVLAFQK